MNKHYDNFKEITLSTTIKEKVDGYYTFEDTIFYGEKGGMLSDKGCINGLKVLELKWDGDTLLHKVDGELENPIEMKVCRRVRYLNTAVQSALHLLDGYYAKLGLYLPSVGVNPDNQWFEVNSKDIDDEHLLEVQRYMDNCIMDAVDKEVTYIKGSEYEDEFYHKFDELRIVKFGDLDRQPCGTLHIDNTSDIMNFVILDHEKTSRGTKVYFTCNFVTNDRFKEEHDLLKNAAKAASVSKHELVDKVNDLVNMTKKQKKEIEDLKKELLAYKALEILATNETLVNYETEDLGALRTISQSLMNKVTKNMIIYTVQGTTIHFSIISCDDTARDIFNTLKEKLGIGGGGSPKLVSAKANMHIDELLPVLKEMGF